MTTTANVMNDNSNEYVQAHAKMNLAQKEFDVARDIYRKVEGRRIHGPKFNIQRMVDDSLFLDARFKFNEAEKEFDAAFDKESNK